MVLSLAGFVAWHAFKSPAKIPEKMEDNILDKCQMIPQGYPDTRGMIYRFNTDDLSASHDSVIDVSGLTLIRK